MATSEVTRGAKADIYGQLHPVETADVITTKLEEFHREIKKLPEDTKKWLMEAEERCPELVTDDFKLIFLRSEVFNADVRTLYSYRCFRCSPVTMADQCSHTCPEYIDVYAVGCQTVRQVLGQACGDFWNRQGFLALDVG